MRLRIVLLGVISIIFITLSITSYFVIFNKKEIERKKFFYCLNSFILLISLISFGYVGNNYYQIKYKKVKMAQTVVIDGKEIKTMANAKERLVLPMAYDTVEATHPSVLNMPKAWHGFKYWMAVTAYPKGDSEFENPHIIASNDLIQWQAPEGLTNPLDEPKSTNVDKYDRQKQYNSDTHLIYNEELARLEVFWRYVDDVNNQVTIFRSTTTDGSNWSEKESIYTANRKQADWVSPAFVKDKDGYTVWYIANGYKLWSRKSTDGLNWTEPQELQINYNKHNEKMKNWHLDVQKFGDTYEMLMVGFKMEGNKSDISDRHKMNLYHATSSDGKKWSTLSPVIYPSQKQEQWDGKGIYRSCFIKEDNKYYVFYSGIGFDDTRGIGLSYGEDITNLKGLDYDDWSDLFKKNN